MRSGLGARAPSITHSNHFKKTRQKLHKPIVALIFLPDLMYCYLIYHLSGFLIIFLNEIIGSSHPQLCKKNSCSHYKNTCGWLNDNFTEQL